METNRTEGTESPNLDEDIGTLTELGQRLINSILEGETLDCIKSLIDVGAPLWYQSEEEGMSSLHAAAYTENEEVVKLLIEKGAVWNAGGMNSVYLLA